MTDSKIRVGDIFICKDMSGEYCHGIVVEIMNGEWRTCKLWSGTKHWQYISTQALRTLPKYERIGHVDLNEEWKRILQGVLNDREAEETDK